MSEANEKTPLYALHVELGARIAPFAGYAMPIQYPAGVLAEHLHTRKAPACSTSRIWARRSSRAPTTRPSRACLSASAPPTSWASRLGGSAIPSCSTRRRHRRRPDGRPARRARTGGSLVVNAARKEVDFAPHRASLPAGVRLTPLPDDAR